MDQCGCQGGQWKCLHNLTSSFVSITKDTACACGCRKCGVAGSGAFIMHSSNYAAAADTIVVVVYVPSSPDVACLKRFICSGVVRQLACRPARSNTNTLISRPNTITHTQTESMDTPPASAQHVAACCKPHAHAQPVAAQITSHTNTVHLPPCLQDDSPM